MNYHFADANLGLQEFDDMFLSNPISFFLSLSLLSVSLYLSLSLLIVANSVNDLYVSLTARNRMSINVRTFQFYYLLLLEFLTNALLLCLSTYLTRSKITFKNFIKIRIMKWKVIDLHLTHFLLEAQLLCSQIMDIFLLSCKKLWQIIDDKINEAFL